jgi:uncharacterized protein (TIGR02147 family)
MRPIYTYLDYRKYIKDYYTYHKENVHGFSYRVFSRMAGLKTTSFIKHVIDGDRNLTARTIGACSKAMKLNKPGSVFFETLVLFNQSKSDEERDLYFDRLIRLKPKIDITGLKKDQLEYYSKPYYVVIREMVALPDFKEDPAWIVNQLGVMIKPQEVGKAIGVLLRLNLLVRNEQGKLTQNDVTVETPQEVESLQVFCYHRDMMNMAKVSLVKDNSSLRDISSLTVPIDTKQLPQIKKMVDRFRQELVEYLNTLPADYNSVYQVNLQVFPITKVRSEKKKENNIKSIRENLHEANNTSKYQH